MPTECVRSHRCLRSLMKLSTRVIISNPHHHWLLVLNLSLLWGPLITHLYWWLYIDGLLKSNLLIFLLLFDQRTLLNLDLISLRYPLHCLLFSI